MDRKERAPRLARLAKYVNDEIVACMDEADNHGEFFYEVARLVSVNLILRFGEADTALKSVGILAGTIAEVMANAGQVIKNNPLMQEYEACKTQDERDVVLKKMRAEMENDTSELALAARQIAGIGDGNVH